MKSILIAEDDKAFAALVETWLSREGFALISVASVQETIDCIESNAKIDLALIDFWLEGANAVSVYEALQKHRPEVPTITMTGGAEDFPISSTHAVAEISGANAFLQKPFRRQALVEAINRLI